MATLRSVIKAFIVATMLFLLWLVYSVLRINLVESQQFEQPVQPYSIKWVHAFDTQIAYQQFGPKSTNVVLLVHGTGAWSGTWVSNVDAMIKAGYQVIALDLPPFGFSAKPSTQDFSRQAQAKRIIAFTQALNLKKPVLLGHSFGGGPVAESALMAPDNFSALIFVDAALGTIASSPVDCANQVPPGDFTTFGVYFVVAALGTQPWMSSTLLKQFVTRKESVTAERTALYQVPFQRKEFSAGLARWATQFALGCENPLSADQHNYNALVLPTDVIWGELDTVTPIEQGLRLNQLIDRSTLHKIAAVGHIPQIEDVASFNLILSEILIKRRR
jgi:pimeloyl-ACP methyl ester carboxylesterase